MSKLIDLTGKRFGRLVVVEQSQEKRHGNCCWLCRCDCGKEKVVRSDHLRSHRIQSCGCLCLEKTISRNIDRTTHGLSNSNIYYRWAGIIQRCTNPNNKEYKHYGARGITVCERWLKFENFLKDMGLPPTDKCQIDRIDNDNNYCKENCRWTTPKINSRNRRDNHLVTHNGKTQCIAMWAEEINIKCGTLSMRLKRGWTTERALTVPIRKNNEVNR